MKRKILIILLSIMSVVCLALGLSACDQLSSVLGGDNDQTQNGGSGSGGGTGSNDSSTAIIGGNGSYTGDSNLVATESLIYTISADGTYYTVTGINDTTVTEIVVASTYNGLPVEYISQGAFAGCGSVTSITLPFVGYSNDSLLGFGYIFGTEQYVGGTAILLSGDVTYYIPITLRTITVNGGKVGYGAFMNCSKVTSISINSGENSVNTSSLFYNCSSLTDLYLFGEISSIGDYAFYGCSSLESIDLPEYITTIGDYAFCSSTSLKDISIGKDITSIGEDAFTNTAFYNNESNYNDDILYINTCLISAKTSISGNITINSKTTLISTNAFQNCTLLTSIIIQDNVKYIGSSAFNGCSGLTSITIPFVGSSIDCVNREALLGYIFGTESYTGGTSIYQNYCSYSYYGKDYYIPSNLTHVIVTGGNIRYGAFCNCSDITDIILSDNVAEIYSGGSTVTIGHRTYKTYSPFANFTSLKNITIGKGITSIPSELFTNCTSLSTITLGTNITSIGTDAFKGCDKLEKVYISDLVSWCNISFGNDYSNPMYYAANLYLNESVLSGEITLSNEVSVIPKYTFKNSATISITVPDSVTYINDYAFYNSTLLKNIILPNSIIYIGENTFYNTAYYNDNNNWDNDVLYIGNYLIKANTSISGKYTIKEDTTVIANYAFCNCTLLTGVSIVESITNINNGAFYGCTALTEINFNATAMNDLSSCNYVFYNAGRNSDGITVTIGANVIKLPANLFYSYSSIFTEYSQSPNIISVVFKEESVCENIGVGAFEYCATLESITLPNSITSIGDYALAKCTSLTTIVIPESVTSIGSHAFWYCTVLESITIPSSLTVIESSAFNSCSSLTYIHYNGTASQWAKISFDDSEANPLYFADYLYLNGILAKDITLEDTTNINPYAFYNCSSITSVTIPVSVTSIGSSAFLYCTSLTSVYYSGTASQWANTSFSNDAANPLYYAVNLYLNGTLATDITIEGITSIGNYAFYNCTSLTRVTIPDSVTSIGSSAFCGCTSLTSLTIGNSVTSIGSNAFYNTAYYNDTNNWEDGVLYIGNYLIAVDTSISGDYTIKDGTIAIAGSAFSGCTSLTSITIPNSVTSIGSWAFYKCTSLESVTIPDSVIIIDYGAFSGCSSLTNIVIPSTVTDIGDTAFYNCTSLTSVTIGSSVTSIDTRAFYNCSSLTSVYYNGTAEEWNTISINEYNTSLTSATIYYYSETKPTGSGNYWHYNENDEIVIW